VSLINAIQPTTVLFAWVAFLGGCHLARFRCPVRDLRCGGHGDALTWTY
jgi:hypothetical protein